MPSLKRDLIELARGEDRVLNLTKEGKSPAAIATELRNDPVFMDAIGKFGYSAVFPKDIHNFLARCAVQTSAILDGTKGDAAQVAINAAKERILSTMQLGMEWESLARRGISILTSDLDAYEMEREAAEQYNSTLGVNADPSEKRKMPDFPHDTFTTTRRAVVACVQMIQALRGDHQLQGMVKANTVNIRNGVTQEEMHDILFGVGGELGVTRSQVLEAYTKFLIKKKAAGKPIDVSANEGKWEGRLPFVQVLEKSTGTFPGDASVKA